MSPAAMIGIALAILCIGLITWKKCINKLQTQVPTPLAPLILMPITNPLAITKSNAFIPISISIS
jgi:hypothetical protein